MSEYMRPSICIYSSKILSEYVYFHNDIRLHLIQVFFVTILDIKLFPIE
jgi:hypothetical protein